MKKFFTLLASLALISASFAQTCMQDSSIIGAAFPVQPLPYDPVASPDGGIRDTACIDQYFEFSFSAAVGDTFALNGLSFPLDSIRLPATNGVGNLPSGITYNCNPGNCVFIKNTLGCILLYGTVTDPALVGDHNLTIAVEIFVNGSPAPLAVQLPIPTVTPGNYTLAVREADFSNCASVGTFEPLESLVSIQNVPNPFSDITTVQVKSYVNSEVSFEVMDMTGRQVHQRNIILNEGNNSILFDGSGLSEGVYFYAVKNELGTVSGKMVVSK